MKSFLRGAARFALHECGGLAALRALHRRQSAILMFHAFSESDRPNVEALCTYVARHFEPVSLTTLVSALQAGKPLPSNAVTVTVDDGYRNFFEHGHPVFGRYRIPTTLFAVSGFSAGRLWLWTDKIEFGVNHAPRTSLCLNFDGERDELPLTTREERVRAVGILQERLKEIPNERRLRFLAEFGDFCGVEIPQDPPPGRAAMSWPELRAAASEGVEIGCHTASHPILSRLSDPSELDREIRGAAQEMESHLGFPVRHFCYPNGRPLDIGNAAVRCVEKAGFASAVTCSWGFNSRNANRLQLQRIPLDSAIDYRYGIETLAGLHL